ncbi:MAG TPA: cyclopropane-fatty-acyl-phospholipid synthase family protein, partial [Candidatus Sulfotelmatobacter sp.]|nr:cyclopropane-fatty-acyl-phospholipid synthase family protein [Candidatus Sulfotelmatobacter sp.]
MYLLGRMLESFVRRGTLTLVGPDGSARQYGDGKAPHVRLAIADKGTARRVFLNPGLALGEAYMDGLIRVEQGDIYDFLDLCFANLGWDMPGSFRRMARGLSRLGRRVAQYNPIRRARQNVAHHYDLSDNLYDLFLDSDRQYSCAYYLRPGDSLEQAQAQKKRHIASKLLLKPGQKVLDIGSGWGGLGLYLAQVADADVTGLTLSQEQHKVSNRRARDNGLGDRVRFEFRDYRQEYGRYDRIVSVGMFEHVGIGHYRTYFEKLRDLLADDGVALLHTIGRADGPGSTNAWIRKYIFPGGYSPALSEIVPVIERVGLHITDIEILRLHYAETLKAWRRRFNANRKRIAEIYDERFCRMWEFYLAASEATFRHSGHVNFQIQLAKKVDTVPLTRDYMLDWERDQRLEFASKA